MQFDKISKATPQKVHILQEYVKLNWNFQEVGNLSLKTFSGEGEDVFWNNTIKFLHSFNIIINLALSENKQVV